MKKIISLFLVLTLVLSMVTVATAAVFDTVERNEAESTKISKKQGETAVIENANFSGGSAVELTVTKYDEWLKNDYMRFAVPVNQRAVFTIKVGVKKGPNQGIMQLWFSDVNERIGEKIDLYSPTEEYVEVNLGDFPCNIQYTGRWFEFRVDGKNPASKGANINVDYIQLDYADEYEPRYSDRIPYLEGEAPKAYGDEPYAWGQLMEGGTGRSNHLVIHPTEPGLMYMGTDMGGAYRWEDDTYTWTPLLDTVVDASRGEWLGIDGIGVDPNDANVVYLCVGTASNKGNDYMGAVLKSTDRGDTWTETGFKALFSSNADPARSTSERIGVEPGNSNNVWVGTMVDGLYRSRDGFKTWEKVEIPVTLSKNKVFPSIVAFDERTKSAAGCSTIYIAIEGYGLIVTRDNGETWEDVEGCPSGNIRKMKQANDGTFVVVTASSGLWTFKDGIWKDISPAGNKKWATAEICKTDSNYIITSWNKGPIGSFGQYTYYTTDGGQNWRMFRDDMIKNHTTPRLEWGAFLANVTDIVIDPYNKGRVFMCGWSNFYMTDDIFAEKPVFTNHTIGVEHGCSCHMISLPKGARLIMSPYDYAGGRYTDPTQYCDEMLPPKEANPSRIAFCENDPNFIVRIGKNAGAYSTDNGINWRAFGALPEELNGIEIHDAAVSSDIYPETGYPAVYVVGHKSQPFVTYDLGETWMQGTGAVAWHNSSKWGRGRRIATDKKDANIVYYLAKDGLYKSEDWGVTYTLIAEGATSEYNSAVVRTSFATNGAKAGVWYSESEGDNRLWYSSNQGLLFKNVGNFTWVRDFDFGKPESDDKPPVVYVWGTREKVRGLHASYDNGKTWKVLHNDATAKQKLVTTMVICADRQTFGAVYVGSSGRGTKFGVPANMEHPFYTNKDDEIKVMINSQLEIFDVEPQLINDRTMVPMRRIFEDVGADVYWDEDTQTVTAIRKVSSQYGIEETTVQLTIGSKTIKINDVEKEMDIAPVVINDRTLVPVRFITEALGAKVEWIEDKQLVKIRI